MANAKSSDPATPPKKKFGTCTWEKNQPAKFGKIEYQTLPIKKSSLYLALLFHGHKKRLCPDPMVDLGARLVGGMMPPKMFLTTVLKRLGGGS